MKTSIFYTFHNKMFKKLILSEQTLVFMLIFENCVGVCRKFNIVTNLHAMNYLY